jgi:hypothetical protein
MAKETVMCIPCEKCDYCDGYTDGNGQCLLPTRFCPTADGAQGRDQDQDQDQGYSVPVKL